MSLLDDVKAHYKEFNYPPEGHDLDYHFFNGEWLDKGTKTSLVSHEDEEDLRWGTAFTNVYERETAIHRLEGTELAWIERVVEFVAVSDVRPATQNQDWGDYGAPDIYEVIPETKTITVTTYSKVESNE